MVVRGFGGRFPAISLEDLEALYRASTVDLARRFGARRVGDKYLIPIQGVPWFTLVDLGREYPVDGAVVRGVSVVGPANEPWFSLVIGFLVGDYVLGSALVGRRSLGCRSFPLNPPLDLWDLPRGLDFPRPLAVVSEVSGTTFDVSVPRNCLDDLSIPQPKLVSRYLLIYSSLVSVGGRVVVDLSSTTIAVQG